MRALYTAATGMMAQELNVEVISNNIANMRTTGYKRQRADFQDLLYQNLRRVGTTTSDTGTVLPVGVEVGSGVKTAATPRIMSQGGLLPTEKEHDVAIRGEGFFQIQLPDGRTAYTRDGSFELDPNGVLSTVDGYQVDAGITIPADATSLTINAEGTVEATVAGQTQPQNLGQLQLARFVNKSGLEAMGDNLFLETQASGAPIIDNPGAEGFGSLLQAHLEQANVNAVTEVSDLIAAQRAYEMNAKVISAAEEMLQATTNMR
ncbi:flagellar basal-body rod protein FlgG [Flaviflagellibacter deserti]|jgi:flagellar basal-body rod protein FlgG|uniref:Flagellar basal-body rod protein FlgG n=1 Tax=Flaviflagellibacter deserti TaxID=2267266 RepID=A0ABV9Z772_9HYPH